MTPEQERELLEQRLREELDRRNREYLEALQRSKELDDEVAQAVEEEGKP